MRFAYDDQIAAQPAAVAALLGRSDVPALDPTRPVVLTGMGTSLHACRVAAAWIMLLTEGAVRAQAVEAHELALALPLRADDQVVVVSHRGTKMFPGAALARARAAGARTVAVVGQGAPEPVADCVLRTCADERAFTHTVSYLCALATLGQIVARLCGAAGAPLERALFEVPAALRETLSAPAPIAVAGRLARRQPILVTGFGLDAITAAEAALKIKEGTYQWAEGMSVEMALHGPISALGPGLGALSFTPAADDGGRTALLRKALADLGVVSVTVGEGAEGLPFARADPLVRPLVAIVPVQRLVAEIARAVGANPDTIHDEIDPWKTVAGWLKL